MSPVSCETFKALTESLMLLSPLANALLYSFLGKRFRNDLLTAIQCEKVPWSNDRNRQSISRFSRSGYSTRQTSIRYSTDTMAGSIRGIPNRPSDTHLLHTTSRLFPKPV